MADQDREDLIDALRAADAVRFGEFELSHGGTSDYYVDKYRFETDPQCLSLIAEAFATRITEPTLAGVALGAVPLVAAPSATPASVGSVIRVAKASAMSERHCGSVSKRYLST